MIMAKWKVEVGCMEWKTFRSSPHEFERKAQESVKSAECVVDGAPSHVYRYAPMGNYIDDDNNNENNRFFL